MIIHEVIMFERYTNSNAIGLLFSASYCKWCRQFVPILEDIYPELQNVGIEILLVGADERKEMFEMYRNQWPWPSTDFDDNQMASLRDSYDVDTIPALIFVDRNGNILDGDGRDTINQLIRTYDPQEVAHQLAIRLSDAIYNSDDSE